MGSLPCQGTLDTLALPPLNPKAKVSLAPASVPRLKKGEGLLYALERKRD